MATINLGSIKFNWQGAYAGGTAYAVDDVVSYNGSSYICKLASTGNLPTNTTYWDQMSSAGTNGTNGTDLTTTLTTQGDLVYRDGSGLQRLGAGTAGQVLQTGGAGANPSWTNLSSDFVLLATTDASNSATISFDGYFSSTYKNYKLIVSNLTAQTNGVRLLLRFRRSNSDVTTTDGYTTFENYTDSYPNTETDQLTRAFAGYLVDNHGRITGQANGISDSSTNTVNFECHIPDPLGTNNNKSIQSSWGHIGSTGSPYWHRGLSMITLTDAQTALSGLTFYLNSGNITRGNFKLYGIK